MKVKFADQEHLQFYRGMVARTHSQEDPYRKAFFYLLGLLDETRRHVGDLYDFEENGIEPEGLEQGWQTSGTGDVCRLAFNLYNNYVDEAHPWLWTPYALFGGAMGEYMVEALRLRFGN